MGEAEGRRKAPDLHLKRLKNKNGKQTRKTEEAARKVAEIMYASLQEFPREEQEKRMRAIHKISIKCKTSGKAPKRAAAQRMLRCVRFP